MSTLLIARAPEPVRLTGMQHDLVLYALVVAGLALFASFVHSWNSHSEVSSRYRSAIFASLCITGVATLSYLVLVVFFIRGYAHAGGTSYRPTPDALLTIAPRYMDWSVTVPLLMVELLAVCSLASRKVSTLRASLMAAAFAMIITGYFGSQAFAQGSSGFWLWLWFIISCVFFVYLYVGVVPAVMASVKALPADAGRALGMATALLLTTFLVYPLVYLIPIFFHGPWWTTSMQLAYSAADIVAKVGFGMMIHKVAKLRTAADVCDGEDTHPETVWVNSVHHSDGVQPVRRHRDAGVGHPDGGQRGQVPAQVGAGAHRSDDGSGMPPHTT